MYFSHRFYEVEDNSYVSMLFVEISCLLRIPNTYLGIELLGSPRYGGHYGIITHTHDTSV